MKLPEHVERNIMPEPMSGCWLWLGYVAPTGYGFTSIQDRTRRAHRFVYESLVGSIPEGLTLDHLCRVRSCVNPAHLEPVTAAENTLRGEGISAQLARMTHCIRGHEFTHYLSASKPRRECRTCKNERDVARKRLLRALARDKELTPVLSLASASSVPVDAGLDPSPTDALPIPGQLQMVA